MKTHINLLPSSYQVSAMLRARALQWGVAVALVATTVGAGGWTYLRRLDGLRDQVALLKKEYEPLDKLITDIRDMRHQLAHLDDQEAVAGRLETQRRAITLLGAVSKSAAQCGGRLQVESLNVLDLQSERSTAKPNADQPPQSMLLSGVSLDNLTVTQLVGGLRAAGIFRFVELRSLQETTDRQITLHAYEVLCTF